MNLQFVADVADDECMAERFLSATEVAKLLGVSQQAASQALPEPDAIIGRTRGWRVETIDEWKKTRPGRGNWGRRDRDDD